MPLATGDTRGRAAHKSTDIIVHKVRMLTVFPVRSLGEIKSMMQKEEKHFKKPPLFGLRGYYTFQIITATVKQ